MDAVEKRCILWPSDWKEDIIKLSSVLSSYKDELKTANSEQKERQQQLHPIRTVRFSQLYCIVS